MPNKVFVLRAIPGTTIEHGLHDQVSADICHPTLTPTRTKPVFALPPGMELSEAVAVVARNEKGEPVDGGLFGVAPWGEVFEIALVDPEFGVDTSSDPAWTAFGLNMTVGELLVKGQGPAHELPWSIVEINDKTLLDPTSGRKAVREAFIASRGMKHLADLSEETASERVARLLAACVDLGNRSVSDKHQARLLPVWLNNAKWAQTDAEARMVLKDFVVFAVTGQFNLPELTQPGDANKLLFEAAREGDLLRFVGCESESVGLLRSFNDIVVGEYDHDRGGAEAIVLGRALREIALHPADFEVKPVARVSEQQSSPSTDLASGQTCAARFEP